MAKTELINELLTECLKAKGRGADCFFDYAPHVNCVWVYIYKNGWSEDKESADESFFVRVNDNVGLQKYADYIRGLGRNDNTKSEWKNNY